MRHCHYDTMATIDQKTKGNIIAVCLKVKICEAIFCCVCVFFLDHCCNQIQLHCN